MARFGTLIPTQRDEIEAVISEIPFDLTDERGSGKGNRFWIDFMTRFLNPRQAVDGRITTPDGPYEGTWLGFGINAYMGTVVVPLLSLGRPVRRSLGNLSYIEVSRDNGDTLVAASIPIKTGGSTKFICRASSEDYAAIVRMAARTSF